MARSFQVLIALSVLAALFGCESSETPKIDPNFKIDSKGGADAMSKAKESGSKKRDDEIQAEMAKLGLKGTKPTSGPGSAGAPRTP